MLPTRLTAAELKHALVDGIVKIRLLPSTFDVDGKASSRQHLTCFVIDDCVAIDAGSLAMAVTPTQRANIRDIVITHAHLDHIAGLPLFIDDLFATLDSPIRVHATNSVIEVLERDIFNWSVYPRFSELSNEFGSVLEYRSFEPGDEFPVRHLRLRALEVNHKVPSSGFLISDADSTIALTGDTAEMDGFWETINGEPQVSAILVECAFPNDMEELAAVSHHLTPRRLAVELGKCRQSLPVYIVNLKPLYRDAIIRELDELGNPDLRILDVGRDYELGLQRLEAI